MLGFTKVGAVSKIEFTKYSGTGNDFVVIDNRAGLIALDNKISWNKICDRKFGVGADGVLFLNAADSSEYDYRMVYLNADGGEVSMCGNGARCLAHFASFLNIGDGENYSFQTMNGSYSAVVEKERVNLKMTEYYDVDRFDLSDLFETDHSFFANTGVPHCVFHCDDLDDLDIVRAGSKVRYDKRFPEGANANFYKILRENHIRLRTYERGVEDETLACGTGAIAAAIACSKKYGWKGPVQVDMPGGVLQIPFNEDFSSIYLGGEVEKIFDGSLILDQFLNS